MCCRRLLLVGLAVLALTPGAARANGDPASDVLLSQDVFIPFDAKIPLAQAGQLTTLVHDAKTHGYPIKVALIATRYDLGTVGALWLQPQRYARFLGQEIFFVYRGRLLIVMPNGYGIYRYHKPVVAERKVLDRLPPPSDGGPGLAAAAGNAVISLAGAAGVKLTLPAAKKPAGRSSNRDRILLLAIALCLLAAILFVPWRRLRR
jgi:hypothetical protein